jgi:hypothetical protein
VSLECARLIPQDGDELLQGRRLTMSPEAVPAYEADVLVGAAAREADSLLQVGAKGVSPSACAACTAWSGTCMQFWALSTRALWRQRD